MLLRLTGRALAGRCGYQAGRRWVSAHAEAEERIEEEVAEDGEDFDRNPISTGMRRCETRHEVAEFMMSQDVSKIIDTHDLEAARMLAHLTDSPLTSQCGRALDTMSTRMKARFNVPDGSSNARRPKNKLANIVKGNTVDKKKEKQVWKPGMQRQRKASGSVNIYLEFASHYARIYYNYARARGGGRRLSEVAKQSPLYVLAKDTTDSALMQVKERAKSKNQIDRPQTVPTAILAMGLLGLRYQWNELQRFIVGSGALAQAEQPFVEWVHGNERQAGWDVEELASVLWGCMEMNLQKQPETRRFIEACLQRVGSPELLDTISPTTLAQVLRVATMLKDTHGPLAEATRTLFNNAERRITALADPNAETMEYQALPPSAAAAATSDETAVTEAEMSQQEADRIKIEAYDDPKYLVGSMSIGQLIEVIEAYNNTGRTSTHVHAAAAGRIVSSQEMRELINDRPDAAVDIMWIYTGAYSKPLYDVLCAPLTNQDVWKELRLLDLHRVLVALHQSEYPSRATVFSAVEKHLLGLLSKGSGQLSPAELSSLRTVLMKVGIENSELYSLLDLMAIGS